MKDRQNLEREALARMQKHQTKKMAPATIRSWALTFLAGGLVLLWLWYYISVNPLWFSPHNMEEAFDELSSDIENARAKYPLSGKMNLLLENYSSVHRALVDTPDSAPYCHKGVVIVEFDVTSDGQVVNAHVIEATVPDVFQESAVRAAEESRYAPKNNNFPDGISGVQQRMIFKKWADFCETRN